MQVLFSAMASNLATGQVKQVDTACKRGLDQSTGTRVVTISVTVPEEYVGRLYGEITRIWALNRRAKGLAPKKEVPAKSTRPSPEKVAKEVDGLSKLARSTRRRERRIQLQKMKEDLIDQVTGSSSSEDELQHAASQVVEHEAEIQRLEDLKLATAVEAQAQTAKLVAVKIAPAKVIRRTKRGDDTMQEEVTEVVRAPPTTSGLVTREPVPLVPGRQKSHALPGGGRLLAPSPHIKSTRTFTVTEGVRVLGPSSSIVRTREKREKEPDDSRR